AGLLKLERPVLPVVDVPQGLVYLGHSQRHVHPGDFTDEPEGHVLKRHLGFTSIPLRLSLRQDSLALMEQRRAGLADGTAAFVAGDLAAAFPACLALHGTLP